MNQVRTIEFAQYGATNAHPVAILFMVCMLGLVLLSRRSTVVFAVLAVCAFMPMDQRVVIGGLDFTMLRLTVMSVWLRIIVKGEYRGLSLGKLDRLFLLWTLVASIAHVLRVPGAFVYRAGVSFDVLTAFFLIRVLVREPGQVLTLWKHMAWVVVVLSPFFVYEAVAQHNFFGMFDYSGFDVVEIRDGRPRSQGPFSHPILAGTFGSVLMPVFFGAYLGAKNGRRLFACAAVGTTLITIASGSSGPVVAWGVGVVGWAMWRFRRRMRQLLWGLVALAVVLHFVREKPIWHLIGRLSSITGGTGYHRYYLIDSFIRRFGEWALIGTDDMAYWGWGMQDVTNLYVAQGVSGGLATLVLFILVLRGSFVQLRLARQAYERLYGPQNPWALLAWGSSVSLTVHCVSFMSVAYFGQMVPFFAFFLATVPAFVRFRRPYRVQSGVESSSARLLSRMPAARRGTRLRRRPARRPEVDRVLP